MGKTSKHISVSYCLCECTLNACADMLENMAVLNRLAPSPDPARSPKQGDVPAVPPPGLCTL